MGLWWCHTYQEILEFPRGFLEARRSIANHILALAHEIHLANEKRKKEREMTFEHREEKAEGGEREPRSHRILDIPRLSSARGDRFGLPFVLHDLRAVERQFFMVSARKGEGGSPCVISGRSRRRGVPRTASRRQP
jgi:hypothetical protein